MIKHWLEGLLNMHWRKVFIEGDQVIAIDKKRRFSIPLAQIEAIWEVTHIIPMCPWENTDFCILLLKDHFFLIGVRTENAVGIMSEIKALRPQLAVNYVEIEYIPWHLRDGVCLGRLFGLPGVGIFPLHYLPKYTLFSPKSQAHT